MSLSYNCHKTSHLVFRITTETIQVLTAGHEGITQGKARELFCNKFWMRATPFGGYSLSEMMYFLCSGSACPQVSFVVPRATWTSWSGFRLPALKPWSVHLIIQYVYLMTQRLLRRWMVAYQFFSWQEAFSKGDTRKPGYFPRISLSFKTQVDRNVGREGVEIESVEQGK